MWGAEGGNLLWQKRHNILKLCSVHQPPYSLPAQRGTAVVNQLSCAPDTQGWLAATLAATSFQLLCLWTCTTWSHHLRHMRYLMHTYAPTPQSSLWDTVSKSSLKPKIPEGFSSTVPIPYPQKRVSKDMWMKAYRENSAQNQGMGFRSMEKKFNMGRGRVQWQRKWEAAPVQEPEDQRNPDTQISKVACPKCLTILITAADSKLCKQPATRL